DILIGGGGRVSADASQQVIPRGMGLVSDRLHPGSNGLARELAQIFTHCRRHFLPGLLFGPPHPDRQYVSHASYVTQTLSLVKCVAPRFWRRPDSISPRQCGRRREKALPSCYSWGKAWPVNANQLKFQ